MSPSSDTPASDASPAGVPDSDLEPAEPTPAPRRPGDIRPSDHIDTDSALDAEALFSGGPRLGPIGWARWFWRQLTSMRTALFLLLLLALAAVPGSIVPQVVADPNGVTQYKIDHPTLYPILNSLQVFNTYTSVWFSAIYLLLFVSLVGCIVPRVWHHYQAMRAKPPKTPFRLNRMAGYRAVPAPEGVSAEVAIDAASAQLTAGGYRVITFAPEREASRGGASTVTSVSAERGYLRETGNLVFHIALLGVLLLVGIGSGFQYTGQRVVTSGQTFVNTLGDYDSFDPGRFLDPSSMPAYAVTLNSLDVAYDTSNPNAIGQPLDYEAHVTAQVRGGAPFQTTIKVNHPLEIGGSSVYLLGNGYAPVITFRNPAGKVIFREAVPFLPQDANLTSQGVIKVPDGLSQQLGIIGVFMPTAPNSLSTQQLSLFPGLDNPRVTMTVFSGDLGLDDGVPVSVYALDTDHLTQIAGPNAKTKGLSLGIGQTVDLPDRLGTVTFDGVERFASLDVHHDPTQIWVLIFAFLVLGGLLTSLFIPRRRLWVKAKTDAEGNVTLEYAGLARGEDPRLDDAVDALATKHLSTLASNRAADSKDHSEPIETKA